jgi:hypothetical protein
LDGGWTAFRLDHTAAAQAKEVKQSGSGNDRELLKNSIERSAAMVKKLTLNSFGKMKG